MTSLNTFIQILKVVSRIGSRIKWRSARRRNSMRRRNRSRRSEEISFRLSGLLLVLFARRISSLLARFLRLRSHLSKGITPIVVVTIVNNLLMQVAEIKWKRDPLQLLMTVTMARSHSFVDYKWISMVYCIY